MLRGLRQAALVVLFGATIALRAAGVFLFVSLPLLALGLVVHG